MNSLLAGRVQKAALAAALEAVPDFPRPRAEQEQYMTPAAVAADLLWEARDDGAVTDRKVLDLGCGTGVFALGAQLLGAAAVVGVDVDGGALEIARRVAPAAEFVEADVGAWQPAQPFDTVVMNPPFGAQRKGADRPFYAAAARAAGHPGGTCWFLAQPRTESFLTRQAQELGARLERVLEWTYPIEARFGFHDAAVRTFRVAGYRMEW